MGRIDDELDAQCRRVAADTVQMLDQLRVLADRLGAQVVSSDEPNTWLDGYQHAQTMRSIDDARAVLMRLMIDIVPYDEARQLLKLPQR